MLEDEIFYHRVAARARAAFGVPVSARQVKIADLLHRGYDDVRVARELGVGRRTVQRDVAAIAAMLGARSRFELAFRLGELWHHMRTAGKGPHAFGRRPAE
ncbi:hypothetical protein Afil01_13590 [Actinorhabdospora filicis]|uniref:HTH luxR-type domain-containing protein n=1 Tax=Actinorhabdospora filicis TaxID=1785913 RepID=A0A9W6W229_9ACTN|nr:hypothetical protein [Actinorhabdospora filicis]GLZ76552.1 hypothetical protein Afil01_13590 [Actinorhabdospora filicis]